MNIYIRLIIYSSYPEFKQAHNDLMNLVPSIGEINGDRSNYKFSMIGSEERQYGACDFEIYKNKKTNISVVEPSKNSRGDIDLTQLSAGEFKQVKQAVLTNIKDRSLCLILN
jgi:endonuclease I